MPDASLNRLRLALMNDVLPMGMALIERARKGGISKVLDAFSSENDPFAELKTEGVFAATSIREQLDQFRPGLGNPVMEVEVTVDESKVAEEEDVSLKPVLRRIDDSLNLLKDYLRGHQS